MTTTLGRLPAVAGLAASAAVTVAVTVAVAVAVVAAKAHLDKKIKKTTDAKKIFTGIKKRLEPKPKDLDVNRSE
jgi:galactokinase